ncbi:MAG: peptidylprolyl isomerase [Acidobacteria bacterium]|nr:peptidylprolyl isomerase [Acidobacteriota bacterium]
MKSISKAILSISLIAIFASIQSCGFIFKSEFAKLESAELSTLAESLNDSQKRMLGQNEGQRKQLIQTFKQAFALAQAAEAEGIHKTEKFKNRFALSTEQMLATEYTKRNPEVTISQEEVNGYCDAHKAQFEQDYKMVSEGRKEQGSDEQKEQLKQQWGELMVRAQRARQANLDKEAISKVQLKISKANLLANLYTESLEDKLKPSDADKAKYLAEHPEADIEKLKANAQTLLDRLKKGESFEKLADEFNDDGTRGRGGDLDWFSKGKMDPDFEKAAFSMEKGQVSTELIKTSFGFHIVRVDDKRKAIPAPAPTPAAGADANKGPAAAPTPKPEPVEEIKARHIYVSTTEAQSFERKMIDDKVKRALEDASLKFKVEAPADFPVKIPGFDPNRSGAVPNLNKQMDSNEKK